MMDLGLRPELPMHYEYERPQTHATHSDMPMSVTSAPDPSYVTYQPVTLFSCLRHIPKYLVITRYPSPLGVLNLRALSVLITTYQHFK